MTHETENILPAIDAPTEEQSIYFGRDDIHAVDDYIEVDVEVPEWTKDGKAAKVRIKRLTGAERDEYEESILTKDKKGNRELTMRGMRAKLIVLAVVHPPGTEQAGQRMFGTADVSWLTNKAAGAVDRIFGEAQKLSGLSDDDMDELKEKLGEARADSISDLQGS